MKKVIFRKQPMDTVVLVGNPMVLTTKVLSGHNPTISWEADLGKGWKNVGKGRNLSIKKVQLKHAGNYRCVINGMCSRVAAVSVVEDLEGTVEAPLENLTKENDAFIEILEGTGEDAPKEVVKKVTKAVLKKLPEALKE